jgi:hypothetical protein
LIKQSQEAITRSDVLSERLEAHLFEQQPRSSGSNCKESGPRTT